MASNRRSSANGRPLYAEPLQQAMSPGPTVTMMVSGSPDMRALLDGIMPIRDVWLKIAEKARDGSAWALSAWVQYYHGKPHERVDMHNDMAALLAGQMAVLVALQSGARLETAPVLPAGGAIEVEPKQLTEGESDEQARTGVVSFQGGAWDGAEG